MDSTVASVRRSLADAHCAAGDIDRVLLVGGSTRIPAVAERVAEETGRPVHAEIDPDAVVALGAAVQAAIIAGDDVEALLVDVSAHALGIATFDPYQDEEELAV